MHKKLYINVNEKREKRTVKGKLWHFYNGATY